jgi:hypothetical protein
MAALRKSPYMNLAPLSSKKKPEKSVLSYDCRDDGGEQILDERGDYGAECGADDHTHGEVNDISSQHKVAKPFEHKSLSNSCLQQWRQGIGSKSHIY